MEGAPSLHGFASQAERQQRPLRSGSGKKGSGRGLGEVEGRTKVAQRLNWVSCCSCGRGLDRILWQQVPQAS